MAEGSDSRFTHIHGSAPGHLHKSFGRTDKNELFRQKCEIDPPPFYLTCIACCWRYLVEERNYESQIVNTEELGVKFGSQMDTYVFLDAPKENKNGIVKTEKNLDYGTPIKRTVFHSNSYQLYVPLGRTLPEVLAIGKPINARIESILAKKIQDAKVLDGCYMSYSDAALLELYREKIKKDSLRGTCCQSNEQKIQETLTRCVATNYSYNYTATIVLVVADQS